MMEKHSDTLALSIEEMAAALNLGRGKAYAAIREGGLPLVKVGRRVLVPRAALEKFLEGGDAEPQAA